MAGWQMLAAEWYTCMYLHTHIPLYHPHTHTHYTPPLPPHTHTQEIDQTVLDADEIPNDDLGKNQSELYGSKHTHDTTKVSHNECGPNLYLT